MRNFISCSLWKILIGYSRRTRWAGHVARMGEMRIRSTYKILVGKPDEGHLEHLDIGGRILLKEVLKEYSYILVGECGLESCASG
jgi:hypothetical protein